MENEKEEIALLNACGKCDKYILDCHGILNPASCPTLKKIIQNSLEETVEFSVLDNMTIGAFNA